MSYQPGATPDSSSTEYIPNTVEDGKENVLLFARCGARTSGQLSPWIVIIIPIAIAIGTVFVIFTPKARPHGFGVAPGISTRPAGAVIITIPEEIVLVGVVIFGVIIVVVDIRHERSTGTKRGFSGTRGGRAFDRHDRGRGAPGELAGLRFHQATCAKNGMVYRNKLISIRILCCIVLHTLSHTNRMD